MAVEYPKALTQEAGQWVARLDSNPLEAAHNLSKIGIGAEGGVNPRGRLLKADRPRLPKDQLSRLASYLNFNDPEVRAQTARALGHWGGEEEVEVLIEAFGRETNDVVQEYYVGALGHIGGLAASDALASVVADTSISIGIREYAIYQIDDLITGGSLEDGEQIYQDARGRWVLDRQDVRLGWTGNRDRDEVIRKVSEALAEATREGLWRARQTRDLIVAY